MTITLLTFGILLLVYSWVVYYKRNKNPNWVIIFLPIIFSIVVLAFLSKFTPIDTRLVEYPAESVRHYHIWNENILPKADSLMCDDPGDKSSYVVSHHEYFAMMYKNQEGKEEEKEIPEITYYGFKELWSGQCDSLVDSIVGKRTYGYCKWNKGMYSSLVYTKTEPYNNYFKNILSIYNFENISQKEALEYGLFSRAGMETFTSGGLLEPRQTLIYGLQVPDSISRAASYISTVDHKFRPILLVWEGVGKKEEMIKKQQSYWEGGKDNEVVFCISLNDKVRKQILWSGSFSWANNSDFESFVIFSALHPGDIFNEENYINSLMEGYRNGLWEPRDFSAYQFVGLPLDQIIYLGFSLLIITLNTILVVKIIKKEKTNA